MSLKNILIKICSTLLLLLLIIDLPKVLCNCKDNNEWQCDNGDTIDCDDICDGVENCKDGSDEIGKNCVHFKCSSFAYRCSYGACISGKKKCNGVKDCADNSDETTLLCNEDIRELERGKCGPKEWQCSSGEECISELVRCDGKADCKDASDESIEKCAHIACSEDQFRCAYGACVANTTKCNNRKDCLDGSDESPTLCSAEHNPTVAPATRRRGKRASRQGSCKVADFEKGVSTVLHCKHNGTVVQPDGVVPSGTTCEVQCAEGFQLPFSLFVKQVSCEPGGYWDIDKVIPCSMQCGQIKAQLKTQLKRSIAGNKAIEQVPWHVAIFKRMSNELQIACSGTIISPKFVLTAQHCFWDHATRKLKAASDYVVIAGTSTYKITNTNIAEPMQSRDLANIYVNEPYNADNHANDLALIELKTPLQFSSVVRPICLAFNDDNNKMVASNITGAFAGWATIDDTGLEIENSQVKSINAQTLSHDHCTDEIRKILPEFTLSADKFCITKTQGGMACRGDTGSAFYETYADMAFLTGIISHATGSKNGCTNGSPVALTDVQYYMNIIKERLNADKY